MDQGPTERRDWIKPLLARLDLVKEEVEIVDPNRYWIQLENSRVLERVGTVVADINEAAGYHVLEMLDFLPPQETVLRVTLTRRSCRHHMELILRESGFYLVFSASKRGVATLEKYFPSLALRKSCTIAWEQIVHPNETVETDIQAWLSYLLSGLDRSFRPDMARQGNVMPEIGFSRTPRKEASA